MNGGFECKFFTSLMRKLCLKEIKPQSPTEK